MHCGDLALFSLPRVQSRIDGHQNVGCPDQTWFLLFRAPLHKTMVTLQLMISLQSVVTIIDFLNWLWSSVAMVVTVDCRDTINCKVTIVLCTGPQAWSSGVCILLPVISWSQVWSPLLAEQHLIDDDIATSTLHCPLLLFWKEVICLLAFLSMFLSSLDMISTYTYIPFLDLSPLMMAYI